MCAINFRTFHKISKKFESLSYSVYQKNYISTCILYIQVWYIYIYNYLWIHISIGERISIGVSKNRGKTSKMDGENSGKTLLIHGWFGVPPIVGNIHIGIIKLTEKSVGFKRPPDSPATFSAESWSSWSCWGCGVWPKGSGFKTTYEVMMIYHDFIYIYIVFF